MYINPFYLEKYVKAYQINTKNALPPSGSEVLYELIHKLISEQNYTKAAKYIHCFNVHEHFDCKKLGITLIHRDHPEQAVELISGTNDRSILIEVISQLNPGKHNHLASDAIKANNLSIDDFPNLKRHQVFAGLRSFLSRHDWYKTEEIALQRYNFYGDKNAMNTFVEVLKSAKMPLEMHSVQVRHQDKLSSFHKAVKIHHEPIPNALTETDFFGPTEVALHDHNIEDYLTLEDFGVTEEDVLFLDDDSTKEFADACDHLLSATMVNHPFFV